MTDQDGDSHMQTAQDQDSPSPDTSRSSSMFPAETPNEAPGTSTGRPIDLTPPHSQLQAESAHDFEDEDEDQNPSNQDISMADDAEAQNLTGDKITALAERGAVQERLKSAGEGYQIDENAPGFAWKNRRAVEDAEKMFELVCDKGFSVEDFDDPVLERAAAAEEGFRPYSRVGAGLMEK